MFGFGLGVLFACVCAQLSEECRMAKPKKKPCKVCVRIRYFFLLVGLVVVGKLISPEARLPEGINYGALVGDLTIAAFVGVFVWKVWAYRQEQKAQAQRAVEEPWRLAIREVAESRKGR
jgi:membrane protein CcdC involved in cytochrome C biogenesis